MPQSFPSMAMVLVSIVVSIAVGDGHGLGCLTFTTSILVFSSVLQLSVAMYTFPHFFDHCLYGKAVFSLVTVRLMV